MLLEKLVQSNEVRFGDLELNGFCYLVGFCDLMKVDKLERLLVMFLFKGANSVEETIERILAIHRRIDLSLVYSEEKLYTLLKYLFSIVIQSLPTETVLAFVDKTCSFVFDKRNVGHQ